MKNFSTNKILTTLSVITIVIIINCIANFFPNSRIDCTKEKKYTLSNETKEVLSKIDDKIFFKIYFEGKSFTKEMEKYRNSIESLINDFKYYSNLIEYDFVDINDLEEKNKEDLIINLMDNGILVTDHPNLTKEKIAWGGYMTYGKYNYEEPIILLDEIDYYETEDCINQPDTEKSDCIFNNRAKESQKNIEYLLIKCIEKAINYNNQKSVGLLYSYLDVIETRYKHGNIAGRENWLSDQNKTKYLKKTLSKEGYEVEDFLISGEMINDFTLNNNANPLGKLYDCIIVNQPINQFDDEEKIIIDQYIMHGGKTIWLMDGLQQKNINENSIIIPKTDGGYSSFLSSNISLNFKMFFSKSKIQLGDNNDLDSMLTNYGAIINNDIIRDYINSPIKYPDRKLYDWDYYPTLEANIEHPILNNIQKIRARFVSSIEIINNKNIKTISLLESSENTIIYSKDDTLSLYDARLRINPKERNQINIEKYKDGKKTIAVLLEGKFDSAFKKYVWKKNNMKKTSIDNKMIIISDGDLFSSSYKINYSNSQDLIYPLGYDPFLNKKFDNSIFAANCVNFLLEKPTESGKYLFEIKNKQFDNYPFNESKIKSKQKKWSVLNNIIPISLILFISLVNYIFRRKKYS